MDDTLKRDKHSGPNGQGQWKERGDSAAKGAQLNGKRIKAKKGGGFSEPAGGEIGRKFPAGRKMEWLQWCRCFFTQV